MSVELKTRCAYCHIAITATTHKVLTEYGWAHPLCVMNGSDWSPKSW